MASEAPDPVDFVVIGSMKCGTTSLHHYLSAHPDLVLPPEKEVNFFFGADPDGPGNLWQGVDWYRARLPADGRLRGDVSPGYTSPDHPDAAERIAELAPRARLLYLVRDPLDRAVSQYRHHRRDGTEPRPIEEALLDPDSHYVLRSRYADRLAPFLERFDAAQIAVVDHANLLRDTGATVASICRFIGVADRRQPDVFGERLNGAGSPPPPVDATVASGFRALVADDAAAFDRVRPTLTSCAPAGVDAVAPGEARVARQARRR
jgi:hypothetical protein